MCTGAQSHTLPGEPCVRPGTVTHSTEGAVCGPPTVSSEKKLAMALTMKKSIVDPHRRTCMLLMAEPSIQAAPKGRAAIRDQRSAAASG